jgi:hypothetical protein
MRFVSVKQEGLKEQRLYKQSYHSMKPLIIFKMMLHDKRDQEAQETDGASVFAVCLF